MFFVASRDTSFSLTLLPKSYSNDLTITLGTQITLKHGNTRVSYEQPTHVHACTLQCVNFSLSVSRFSCPSIRLSEKQLSHHPFDNIYYSLKNSPPEISPKEIIQNADENKDLCI